MEEKTEVHERQPLIVVDQEVDLKNEYYEENSYVRSSSTPGSLA